MFRITPVAATVQSACRNWRLFTTGRASLADWRELNYEVAMRSGKVVTL